MIRVLSVRQPWAELIVRGAKREEFRGYRVAYEGWLAIHASQARAPRRCCPDLAHVDGARGALVGLVWLGAKLQLPDESWAWQLSRPFRITDPIEMAGRLGLWRLAPEVERRLARMFPTLNLLEV